MAEPIEDIVNRAKPVTSIQPYRHGNVATAASASLTVSDIERYSTAIVVISGLTVETVDITGVSGNGVSQALTQHTNGTAGAATTLGNGTFYLKDIVSNDLVFTKSAAAETVTIDVDLK